MKLASHHFGRSARGFTLVELLVVIGIIAVLVAILLPALIKARQAAMRLACLSNMRQVSMELQMYAQEYNDFAPLTFAWTDRGNSAGLWTSTGATWTLTTGFTNWGRMYTCGYMKIPEIYYCATESNPLLMPRQNQWDPITTTHPNQWPPGFWNQPGSPPAGTAWGNANTRAGFCVRPVAAATGVYSTQWFEDQPRTNALRLSAYANKVVLAEILTPTSIIARHGTGVNVVMGDGSGKWVPYSVIKQKLTLAYSFGQYSAQRNNLILTRGTPDTGIWADLDLY